MNETLYDDVEAIIKRSERHLDKGDGYVPWGTGLVEGAKDLAGRAVNQLQEWAKDDPDTWTDDALRLMGGGVKNVGNTMADLERRSEEGEVGIRSAAGTALRFMNWSSEQGARLGRTGARAIGVNEELGGFLGSFLPEAIGTKGLSKAAQIGKTTKQLRKLRSLGAMDFTLDAATTGKYALASGEQATDLLSDIGRATKGSFRKGTDKKLKALEQGLNYQTEKLIKGDRLSRTGKAGRLPGTQDLASQGIDKAKTKLFNQVYGYIQKVRKQAPHHIFDHSLTGQAYNRKDALQIIDILESKHGIIGGNHRSNLMAATHNYAQKMKNNIQAEAKRLYKLTGKPPIPDDARVWIELTKEPLSLGKKMELSPSQMRMLDLAGPGATKEALASLKDNLRPGYTSRFKDLGINPKDMRLDPKNMILGKDHMHVIHSSYEKLPERKALMKLIQSNKWLTLKPEQAADEIAKVYKLMENITVNASAERLKLVKTYLRQKVTNGNLIAKKPEEIKKWMINNPHITANLKVTKKAPNWKKLAYTPNDLSDEIRTVFEFDPNKLGVSPADLKEYQSLWNARYASSKPQLR